MLHTEASTSPSRLSTLTNASRNIIPCASMYCIERDCVCSRPVRRFMMVPYIVSPG